MNDANAPKKAALDLGRHALWIGLAFIFIISVAVGLEWFGVLLVRIRLVEAHSFLGEAIHYTAIALVGIDILLLIGVVGKLSWRYLKGV